MKWTEMAQAVAGEFGLRISSENADALLWNETGFPSFWRTDDPVMECSNQVRSALRRAGFHRLTPLRAYSTRLAETEGGER